MTISRRNKFIHGARGLFALSVFVYHVCNSGLLPKFMHIGVPWIVGQSLQYGVELFFGISGFVILAACRKASSTSKFLLERCARIYPVLWVSVISIMMVSIITHRDVEITADLHGLGLFIANLLALPNTFVQVKPINWSAWTLSLEFAFYILVGLYMAKWPRLSNLRKISIVALGVFLVFRQFRAIFFISGILISEGFFNHRLLRPLIRWPLLWLVVFGACWTTAIAALGLPNSFGHLASIAATAPWIPACIALGWIAGTLALAGIAYGEGVVSWLALTWPVQWLGTVSYSFYLWQAPILGFFHGLLRNPAIAAKLGNFAMPVFFLVAFSRDPRDQLVASDF